jgi:hypothetical protein
MPRPKLPQTKNDTLAKWRKTALLSFRALREISEIIERFLVAALLKMTEIDFARNHKNV